MVQTLWRAICQFLIELNTHLPYDSAISFLGTYFGKKICVHSSFIHNSKILEITQNSIKRRSDKHYVLDTEWNSTQ